MLLNEFEFTREIRIQIQDRRAPSILETSPAGAFNHNQTMVQVFVEPCGGSTFRLDIDQDDTVDKIKQMISDQCSIPMGRQRLWMDGRKVSESDQAEWGAALKEGTILRVQLALKGGIDFQNRAGSKPGSGGVSSESQAAIDRRERLRQLAMETVDLAKDPYFMKNHLGTFECKLCLTLHNNEGNYLAHTQGKRHQTNLARRAAKEAAEAPSALLQQQIQQQQKDSSC